MLLLVGHDARMANVVAAEVCVTTSALAEDHAFFVERLGFRMESIFPADDPRVVVLIGYGARIRLEARGGEASGGEVAARLRLRCAEPEQLGGGASELVSPGGVRIALVPAAPALHVPAPRHQLLVNRLTEEAPWVVGRAGMLYRDLVPGRLGGAMIASHIRIPVGGPVPDLLHYHDVHFQLIYCCKGWVRLVYEDQGLPFVLEAGECVLQPPQIRHRVLEASDGLEVVEVTLPAEHLTYADHELELPTGVHDDERSFGGQRFCVSRGDEPARPSARPGLSVRETLITEATGGVASVRVVETQEPVAGAAVPQAVSDEASIFFAFVLAGEMTLRSEGFADATLVAGDAFVVPPGVATAYLAPSRTFRLLEVRLPADQRARRADET